MLLANTSQQVHTTDAVLQDCVLQPGTRRATKRAGRYQRGLFWPTLPAQRERRAPGSESASSCFYSITRPVYAYANEHCCRASKISGTEQTAAQPASRDNLRTPEELLVTLQAACQTDTAGGMHFWEVARSLRCPPPACANSTAQMHDTARHCASRRWQWAGLTSCVPVSQR